MLLGPAVLVPALAGLLVLQAASAQEAQSPRPNVVFILADDAGLGDLGCYGQRKIATPNLDRMAAEGLRFTHFYAGGTVCVPSRCVLMTGKHTGHAALRENVTQPLPEGTVTLPGMLHSGGYRTTCIGKWALGNSVRNGSPLVQGFDSYYGFIDQILAHHRYPDVLLSNDRRVALPGNSVDRKQYSDDLFTERALRFLEANRPVEGEARVPFFLYLPYCIPHADLDVPEDSMEPYRGAGWPETPFRDTDSPRTYSDQPTPHVAYAGMISRLDRDVGRILDELRELGLERDTLVLFSSDNGPSDEGGGDPRFFDSTAGCRGGKGDLYEGGLRVPLIASWPGKIAPGVSDHVCAAWDVMPTLLDLAGITTTTALDGLSLAPTLLGKPEEQASHETLYWEHLAPGPSNMQALRIGNEKLVRLDVQTNHPRCELYDLSQDPAETHDLAAERPERVAELVALMERAHVPDAKSPLLFSERRAAQGRPRR